MYLEIACILVVKFVHDMIHVDQKQTMESAQGLVQ